MATPLLKSSPIIQLIKGLGFRVARDVHTAHWVKEDFSETNRVEFSAQLSSDNVIYMWGRVISNV